MTKHGIPWYIMVYHDKAWHTMVYHGISWYIFIKALAIEHTFVFLTLLIGLFLSLLITNVHKTYLSSDDKVENV